MSVDERQQKLEELWRKYAREARDCNTDKEQLLDQFWLDVVELESGHRRALGIVL